MSADGDSDSCPEKELTPFWTLTVFAGLILLISFAGMLFSTIMAYQPFELDYFCYLTNMELGGCCIIVYFISAGIFSMGLFQDEEETVFSALAKFFSGVFIADLLLIILAAYLIQPIEEHYSNGFDGGAATLIDWSLYVFGATILVGIMLPKKEQKDEEQEDE